MLKDILCLAEKYVGTNNIGSSITTAKHLQNIPYYFTTAYDRDNLVEQSYNQTQNSGNFSWIFDCIDWNRFVFYQTNRGFLSFAKDRKFDIVNNHPVTQAHSSWVNDVVLKKLI